MKKTYEMMFKELGDLSLKHGKEMERINDLDIPFDEKIPMYERAIDDYKQDSYTMTKGWESADE